MALLDRLRRVPGLIYARLAPLRATVSFRAYTRYSAVRGNVLAGGVAYFAFFSIFPAMAIGFTLFALVLGNQENLQAQVVQYVNATLGATVISYHEGQQGVVTIEQLVQPEFLTATGLIGLVTLLLSGLGWIAALRGGIEAVFGSRDPANFVVVKLWDLVLLAGAGLLVLTSVILSVAFTLGAGEILDLLDIARNPVAEWTANVLGQIVLVGVDAVVFTLLFARLDGVDLPLRDLAGGALLAAIGFSAVKLFATELLRVTSHNRFLAASGVLVGLLIWMNVVARLLLLAASWSATVAADRGHLRTPDPTVSGRALAVEATWPGPSEGSSVPRRPAAAASPVSGDARRGTQALVIAGFVAGALVNRLLGAARRRLRRRLAPSAPGPSPARGQHADDGAARHRDRERRDQPGAS